MRIDLRPALARLLSVAATMALAGAQGEIYLLSGEQPGAAIGYAVASIGDLDMDGVPDVAAAGSPGVAGNLAGIRVWSGKTGGLLLEVHGGLLANPALANYTGIGPAGDVNGDGVPDFWAASYLHPSSVTGKEWAGAVWIHSGVDGGVLYFFEGLKDGELVGYRVAGGADLDADGFADFAIGVPGRQRKVEPLGTLFVGGIDVRSGFDGRLLYQVAADSLGSGGGAPALLNDLDGDGVPDFVTSGNATAPSGPDTMLRWFSGADGSTLLTHYHPPRVPIGASIASAGDVDGDGLFDVVVGSPQEICGAGCSGTVRVYSSADASLLMKFQSPSGPPNERVGTSVDGLGDFDGDGVPDVAAGTMPPNSIAFVISGKTGSVLIQPTGEWDTWFGYAVGGASDLNGDGLGDLLIGHPNNNYVWTGSLHVILAGCPAPQSYCAAKTNSMGCKAEVSWDGLLSLSIGDNFVVRATNVVSNQLGLLLWSRERAAQPFLGGTLCLGGSLVRLAPQSSGGSPPSVDCSGVLSYALTQGLAGEQSWSAGDAIFAQFWYRDPTHPDQTGTGLSDAVWFPVCH
jgi:hypothetical protein